MARKNRISRLGVSWLLFCLLLVGNTQCEARALRRSNKNNSLLNALFKLNFVKTVEPTLPAPANPSNNGDVASLAAADSGDGTNPPFCVNPPDAPSTPLFTSTPSTPFIPDQPPPLPPISPTPPSFEPSPPEGTSSPSPPSTSTPNPPQLGPSPPASVPSPIFVVPSPPTFAPSPPEFGPGGPGGSGGGFLPPIVYPPPLAPPGAGQALWCVAKPTVPDPIIQDAMDYACGSGAECKSIEPSGACYQPNTVLAHASYAFNSYWQMNKASGGTCDFGGTGTIVTRDPSYDKCAFNLL